MSENFRFYLLSFTFYLLSLVIAGLPAVAEEFKGLTPLERLIQSGKFEKTELTAVPEDTQASPDYLKLFTDSEKSKEAIIWLASHLENFDPQRIGAEQSRNFILMHYPLGRSSRDNFDLIVYMPRPQTKELAALGLLLEIQELIPPPSQIKSKQEVALPDHTGWLISVLDGRCFLQIPSSEEVLVFLHSNECKDPNILVESARELNLSRFKAKITY